MKEWGNSSPFQNVTHYCRFIFWEVWPSGHPLGLWLSALSPSKRCVFKPSFPALQCGSLQYSITVHYSYYIKS